mmetsp:Transcript_46035/g.106179  ORF Transcript_46035/g.106179 Transcript_46035/m.106179 type:complete len:247 (+) Transcript_46035:110-850(+)
MHVDTQYRSERGRDAPFGECLQFFPQVLRHFAELGPRLACGGHVDAHHDAARAERAPRLVARVQAGGAAVHLRRGELHVAHALVQPPACYHRAAVVDSGRAAQGRVACVIRAEPAREGAVGVDHRAARAAGAVRDGVRAVVLDQLEESGVVVSALGGLGGVRPPSVQRDPPSRTHAARVRRADGRRGRSLQVCQARDVIVRFAAAEATHRRTKVTHRQVSEARVAVEDRVGAGVPWLELRVSQIVI